jgi:hypothetical protein
MVSALVQAATSSGDSLFGGTDLLRLLVLAFGGALVVGNVLARVRPPSRLSAGDDQGPPVKPPLSRSVVMITIGMVAVVWAVASLAS